MGTKQKSTPLWSLELQQEIIKVKEMGDKLLQYISDIRSNKKKQK